MYRRREILGAVAGATAALAGCGCGDPFPSFGLQLSLEELTQRGGSTTATVAATADFLNREDGGVRDLSIGSYAPGPTLRSTASVGSMTWADVPDENREDGECATSGVLTETVELTTDDPPYWISPRITDQETVGEFEGGEFDDLEGLIYDGPADTWPPDSVTAEDYRPQRIEGLPWPRPNDVAPADTSDFTSISMDVEAECGHRSRSGPWLSTDFDSATVRWARPVPAEGPSRPQLQSIGLDGSHLELRIGLHEVPWEPDRGCGMRRYGVDVQFERTDPEGNPITDATIEHLSSDGDVRERVTVESQP